MAILHTWDQKLNAHFHLHCLVAGGGVSKDKKRFIPCSGDYLFNQQALSLVFRGKFFQRMRKACQNEKIKLAVDAYKKLKKTLFTKTWVVSVRDPVRQGKMKLLAELPIYRARAPTYLAVQNR